MEELKKKLTKLNFQIRRKNKNTLPLNLISTNLNKGQNMKSMNNEFKFNSNKQQPIQSKLPIPKQSNTQQQTLSKDQSNILIKQFESSSNIPSNLNQLDQIKKQYLQENIELNQQEDTVKVSLQQQTIIVKLNADIDNKKKEHQRQITEKDEQIMKLIQENRKLQDQVKNQQVQIIDLQSKMQQQKRLEEQKFQRIQIEVQQKIQRQLAYYMTVYQFDQINDQVRQQNQNPDVDNMSYEELINLGEQIGIVSKGMKQEDIMKIKEVQYDLSIMKDNCDMCSICQSNFENNEKVKELNPCNHIYHPDCINKWLENEKKCPVCMQIIEV